MQRINDFRINHPKEFARFGKFLVTGLVGFIVDFGTFNLMHKLGVGTALAPALPYASYFSAHPEVIEQAFSFTLATISNFLFNYFWIYPEARGANQGSKLIKFLIVSIAGLLVGAPVFAIALAVWRPIVAAMGLANAPINVAGNLALMTRVAILLFWNFFVNRFWTYREVGTK
jgi:putative flippase GtrA